MFPLLLGFFLVLTPLLSVSGTALRIIAANNDDTDSAITALEVRAFGRTMTRAEGHFGDIDIPPHRPSAFAFSPASTMSNCALHAQLFVNKILAQPRAPPALASLA